MIYMYILSYSFRVYFSIQHASMNNEENLNQQQIIQYVTDL